LTNFLYTFKIRKKCWQKKNKYLFRVDYRFQRVSFTYFYRILHCCSWNIFL